MAAVGLRRNKRHLQKNNDGDPGAEKTDKDQYTERDAWWLYSFRETPIPGTYNLRDFLEEAELRPVQPSYNFKGSGRKKPLNLPGTGDALLPGCYKVLQFGDLVEKIPLTYSFKNTPRNAVQLGVKDKDVNIDPWQYNLTTPPVDSHPCKNFMFRSAVKRFPTTYFIPKEGPGPGQYSLKSVPMPSISSSFKSSVPRFRSSYNKTPGPGTYDPTRQLPKQPPTLAKMGRSHGLFFRNSFDF
ncbi:protein STPG4 [Hyperolius riggenbachi]|uniref:protein STPG4 n=1 Tax=Hyperolius riggenbachi TaxID=752182 RepID=UPI0035A285FC